jgi:AAA+ superfamily predicted ATPase
MTAAAITDDTETPTAGSASADTTIGAGFGAHLERLTRLITGDPDAGAAASPGPPELDRISNLFGLSDFERDVLMLCAGVELDGRLAQAVADAGGDPTGRPTFALALDRLPDAHWDALSPSRPLRYWQLIAVDGHRPLTSASLAADEAILMALTGVAALDARLDGFVRVEPLPPTWLPPSYQALAFDAAHRLDTGQHVCLIGGAAADHRIVAAQIAATTGRRLLRITCADLCVPPPDRAALHRLLARAALLLDCLIMVEATPGDPGDAAAMARIADDLQLPGLICGARVAGPATVTRQLQPPRPAEQQAMWAAALAPLASEELDDQYGVLARTFRVDTALMRSVAADVAAAEPASRSAVLWESTRRGLRSALDGLAQRVALTANWDDLVLPDDSRAMLREMTVHARQGEFVSSSWADQRGLGVTALFTGDSGTGKTMAAEVVAGDLGLDLYRIDLAQVVNKYIGETEKNLARVFNAAESSGAVLLFDEADALFGKRSDVKDARDRYANLEVAYLLARMESYRGVAVLTTNLASTLDRAFLRRLRFVVPFPFPDMAARKQLWQKAFPPSVAVEDLDFDGLARLPLSGGTIRTIAMAAAIAATATDAAVHIDQVLAAARREYIKAGKTSGLPELTEHR